MTHQQHEPGHVVGPVPTPPGQDAAAPSFPGPLPAPPPAHTFAAPRPARAHRAAWILLTVSLGTLLLVAGAGSLVVLALENLEDQATQPGAGTRPVAEMSTDLSPLYVELNQALADQDREAFLSHVTGPALDPLTLWWDNMDALGWTTAVISPVDEQDLHMTGSRGEIAVVLGADMSYPQTLADSGEPTRGGELLTLGSHYVATIDVTADGQVISTWGPWGESRPWDETALAVVAEDGIVVAGLPEEQALIAEVARVGSPLSAWARADYATAHDRPAPLEGFVVFATEDEELFAQWFAGVEEETLTWDPTGFAFAGWRPWPLTPGLAPELATGTVPAGGLVAIGPLAMEDDVLDIVLVHEFAHVLQFVDNPTRTVSPPLVTIEGWATYQEIAYLSDGSYPTSGPYGDYLAECAGGETPAIPTDADLLGEDAACAYSIASTIFAFAEINGVDPAQLADLGTRQGVSPFGAAQRLGTPLSGDAWAAWFDESYR